MSRPPPNSTRTANRLPDTTPFRAGYRLDRSYALEVLRTAYDAGADVVALCDTNGGMLPGWVADVVHDVVSSTGVRVGIHCHNDTGCAVANTLAAVELGRSEEHTSELQSLMRTSYAVFCLKKK